MPAPVRLSRANVPACLLGDPLVAGGTELAAVDIVIDSGRIAVVEAAANSAPPGAVDLAGRMVVPGFVDMHTHLDKGHIWPRAANPDGSFGAALAAAEADQVANWSADDLTPRMDFALRCAFAHGTVAVRTHLDSTGHQPRISWPVFAGLRERWAGRIALQAVCLTYVESYRGAAGDELVRMVAEHGGILGGFPLMGPELRTDLARLFRLAEAYGLDIDLHVDETADPESRVLRVVAETALAHGFAGRVVCGHCCSLATQPEAEALETLDLVARAGIAIVSLPLCNLYLMDRAPARTPRWRGVTLLHEMRARGIAVAVASDNTRDPFHAYGDLDMQEVLRLSVRIAHLEHPLADWPALASAWPSAICGYSDAGRIAVGASADLVLFEGRSWSEVLARPESRRTVLRAGRAIDTTLPAYAELDLLFA